MQTRRTEWGRAEVDARGELKIYTADIRTTWIVIGVLLVVLVLFSGSFGLKAYHDTGNLEESLCTAFVAALFALPFIAIGVTFWHSRCDLSSFRQKVSRDGHPRGFCGTRSTRTRRRECRMVGPDIASCCTPRRMLSRSTFFLQDFS